MRVAIQTCAATLLLAAPVQAQQVIFFDDFNSELPEYNATPTNWTLLKGTVDIVGGVLSGGLCSDGSACIDMDGSSQSGGQIRSAFFPLAQGVTHTLTFDYSSNGAGPNTLLYGIGGLTEELVVALPHSPYRSVTLQITGQGTEEAIFFAETGSDNMGVVIDNVRLVAGP